MGATVRVGVFGGTFDPPHLGHLVVASEVMDEARLQRLLWVPAATSPHKADGRSSSAAIREEMVRAAIQGDPRFGFSDVELRRGGLSYTIDTVRELKRDHPEWRLVLIMGSDQLDAFHEWKEPEAIAELVEVAAITRSGTAGRLADAVRNLAVSMIQVSRIDISSTGIRDRIARGKSVRHMVPDAVLSIIEREKLYRS